MSETFDRPIPAPAPKEDPEALVLRGRPRPAVRFRRGLIVGIGATIAAALVSLSWIALEPPSFRKTAVAAEGDGPAPGGAPDALADAPRSYGDVPRLGPPLPGDLGRPILEHQRSLEQSEGAGSGGGESGSAGSGAVAESERVAAAAAAARSSPVLVELAQGARQEPADIPRAAAEAGAGSAAATEAGMITASVPASAQRKLEFERSSTADVDAHALRPAPSAWTLAAGTIIPASLITGLNSDLPGMVLAQVTENVRDSVTGRAILVPQGARLIGRYDSAIAYGQRRALIVWNRIVFPDGSSVGIDNVPAADLSGYAGLRDGIDSHAWQLLKGIGLSTLLGVGTQLSLGRSESDLVRAVRESAQQNGADAGERITSRNLDVQPTITVRPGWPVRAILNKDLVLRPWRI